MQLLNTIVLDDLRMESFCLKKKTDNLFKKCNFDRIVVNININVLFELL